jgi:hypothetical protein
MFWADAFYLMKAGIMATESTEEHGKISSGYCCRTVNVD